MMIKQTSIIVFWLLLITTTTANNKMNNELKSTSLFLDGLRTKYEHQPTFLQAVEEMAISLSDLFEDPKEGAFYKRAFEAMTEPERAISFRVPWTDDKGNLCFNRGWRVEFSR
jgi:hypothetical protein